MCEPVHYINRKGKTYFLHAVTTKTGKARYVMSRGKDGALAKLPEGYAITAIRLSSAKQNS